MKHEFLITTIAFLILTAFLLSRSPITAFKPWLDWFQRWDETGKYQCFSRTLMAYYYSPRFMYLLAKMFTNKNEVFPKDWYIDFLMATMRSQARGLIPNAVLTPRYLCESIVPGNDDPGDLPAWKQRIRIGWDPVSPGPGVELRPTKKLLGVWPDNVNDWRVLMCSPPEKGGWGCRYDLQNKQWEKTLRGTTIVMHTTPTSLPSSLACPKGRVWSSALLLRLAHG